MRMRIRIVMAVCATGLALGVANASADGLRIEVSPEGPCPSLTAARDAIRARRAEGTLSGPVTVAVKTGRYACAAPLELTAQDGGTSVAPVRYVAEGDVTLDAGWTLPPGRPLEASASGAAERIPAAVRPQVRQVDLSAFKAKDLDGCRLVGADGTPYVRARYPNEGWMKFPKIEKEKGKGGRPFCLHIPFADDRVASWADEPDVRGIGFPMHDWAPANWKVTQIDAAAKTMELKGSGYGFRTGGRWYASHVLRELDVSGEYYVDRAARTLYYVPRPGDAEKGLSLAGAAGLVRAKGVANVSFEGFAFANAKECALEFVGCTNVSVTGGSVRNCGAGAVVRESAKCRFEGIDAAHFEDRGFVLSGGEPLALVKADNVIANCRIRDWGRAYNGYSGAVSMSGCGARLTGCDISQGAHGAVFFGGTEHLIESNEIHDVCLESGEMGAVYTGRNWSYVGNRIVGNHFHDLPKTCRQPTRAIMLDDGVGSIVIVSNRFERCAEGVCASGFANVIEDNLFVDCRPAVGLWAAWVLPDCFSTNIRNVARLITTLEKAPVDSPVWRERFPWTSLMRDAVRSGKLRDPLTRTRIRNNVFVTPGDEQIHWVRPRDKSPDGYLVEGNVTKRK